VFEAGYLGSNSHKLTGLVDVNPYIPGTSSRTYAPKLQLSRHVPEHWQSELQRASDSLSKRLTNNPLFGSTFLPSLIPGHTPSTMNPDSGKETALLPISNDDPFRADNDFDIRHTLTFSGGGDLPFDQLWKGWTEDPHKEVEHLSDRHLANRLPAGCISRFVE
jgi:hypothetical protein